MHINMSGEDIKQSSNMKKSILAMTIVATAFLASCGNKPSEEVEVEVAPTEEPAPVQEEVEVIEVEIDSATVEVEETPSN
jgi:PBP1b-binding outer membrane lipoprotein LpoB